MKISLLNLNNWFMYGGKHTYMRQLYSSLVDNGVDVDMFSYANPKGSKRIKKLELNQNYFDRYDLIHIIGFWKTETFRFMREVEKKKINIPFDKIVITIHDPNDYNKDIIEFLSSFKEALFIFIRSSVLRHVKSNSLKRKVFIKHPYKRVCNEDLRGVRVVSTARVTYRKKIEIILEAKCGIEVWTGRVDRRYNWLKLFKYYKNGIFDYPLYMGEWDDATEVYPGCCALVDLTVMKDDGGGSQYTFLEAIDFGLDLILHKGWSISNDDDFKAGVYIENANELKKQVRRSKVRFLKGEGINESYERILSGHNHLKIGKEYLETFQEFLNNKRSFIDRKNLVFQLRA